MGTGIIQRAMTNVSPCQIKTELEADRIVEPSADQELVSKAGEVYDRLYAKYGDPDVPIHPPLDELVNTVLSQNTNDRNRDIAFANLTARFPSFEVIRDADTDTVIACIRPAGLANQKAPRIQAILKAITAERGTLDLSFLREMKPIEARNWLTRFNGVGLKTASIVMAFSVGMPAFPVDTHIYRVSGRLGLRPEKMSVEAAHDHLASLFDPGVYRAAHVNLIYHGRETCGARKPACGACILKDLCDAFRDGRVGLARQWG